MIPRSTRKNKWKTLPNTIVVGTQDVMLIAQCYGVTDIRSADYSDHGLHSTVDGCFEATKPMDDDTWHRIGKDFNQPLFRMGNFLLDFTPSHVWFQAKKSTYTCYTPWRRSLKPCRFGLSGRCPGPRRTTQSGGRGEAHHPWQLQPHQHWDWRRNGSHNYHHWPQVPKFGSLEILRIRYCRSGMPVVLAPLSREDHLHTEACSQHRPKARRNRLIGSLKRFPDRHLEHHGCPCWLWGVCASHGLVV